MSNYKQFSLDHGASSNQFSISIKLRTFIYLIGAAIVLASTSACAFRVTQRASPPNPEKAPKGIAAASGLTDLQKTAISLAINAGTDADVAATAAQALKDNCPEGRDECVGFVVNTAIAKLGSNPSIKSVRDLVNALVIAAPVKTESIVGHVRNRAPAMKANIASSAQAGLVSATQAGQIDRELANEILFRINTPTVCFGWLPSSKRRSIFDDERFNVSNPARLDFQKYNQNNFR